MITIAGQDGKWIGEVQKPDDDTLHALDMVIIDRDVAIALPQKEQERSKMLLEALETI